MKKILFFSLLMTVLKLTASAQTVVEFVPSGGYTFPDHVNFFDAYGRLQGAANYGGSVLFNINRRFGIELLYNRLDDKYAIHNYGDSYQTPPLESGTAHINYILAGPVQYFYIPGSNIRPFVGAMLGAAVFSPEPKDYTSNTRFAWGAQMGANFNVSPRFGIRLSARLLSPVEGSDGSFYFGTFGNGAGNTYGGYSNIYQFGFNAGIIIGIGHVLPRPQRVIIHRPAPRRYYRYYP